PAIVIEIVRDCGDRVSRAGLQNPGFRADISKSSVTIVVIEDVCVAGQSARAAHDGNTLPLAVSCIAGSGDFRGIQLDVIADEEIEPPVAVVVKPGAACAPANLFVI